MVCLRVVMCHVRVMALCYVDVSHSDMLGKSRANIEELGCLKRNRAGCLKLYETDLQNTVIVVYIKNRL